MEIIAVINQKGGVGKSTTASALAAGLHQRGYKVLAIDTDAQGNLSYSLNAAGRKPGALEILTGECSPDAAIVHGGIVDIIPSSPQLANAQIALDGTGKEYRLKEALEPLDGKYDYIIIDTPPALGIITINALTAATSAIIPAQAEIYSLQGIGQLSQTMAAVKKYCNAALEVRGILITRYNRRARITQEMERMLGQTAETLGTKIYTARIRECTAIKEAAAVRSDIFTYSTKSNAVIDYNAFVEEFLADKQ